MDYLSAFNLSREPFSETPDPAFFYPAPDHVGCLQKTELSLRLHRGLNVVLGDAGSGKSTLCRLLLKRLASEKGFATHLLPRTAFESPTDFLATVAEGLGLAGPADPLSEWQLKETIKNYLFRTGVHENRTVVLVVDDGHDLPEFCLEILREFLNYETNEYKLLQIVLFADTSFERTLRKYRNLADRINLRCDLEPLSFSEIKALIRYRLDVASDGTLRHDFFSAPALRAVYRAAGGLPGRVVKLCHLMILLMVVQELPRATRSVARVCARKVFPEIARRRARRRLALALLLFAATALLIYGIVSNRLPGAHSAAAPLARVFVGKIDRGASQGLSVTAEPGLKARAAP